MTTINPQKRLPPGGVKFDALYEDLTALKNNRAIKIKTKSALYNPEYSEKLKNWTEHTIEPRPIIVLEGYLIFQDERVRDLIDLKVYLDIPIEKSIKRRSTTDKLLVTKDYFDQVLLPMHTLFVETTKKYADVVVDTLKISSKETFATIDKKIFEI